MEGKERVGEAVKIMIAFLRETGSPHQDGDKAVVLVNNIGVGDEVLQTVTMSTAAIRAPANPESKPKWNAAKADELLESFNKQLLRRLAVEGKIRAVKIEKSAENSNGGLVVRTNVRSGDAALYVHANSSHATASFKKDTSLTIGKRTIDYDQGVQFQSMQGFKLAIRWIDKYFGLDKLETALLEFVTGRASASPQAVRTYIFSDAWAFASCGSADGRPTSQMKLQGKLVSLDDNAGNNFESDGFLNCDVFEKAQ